MLFPFDAPSPEVLLCVIFIGFLIGALSVLQIIKRLHDVNLSGWLWILCYFPPVSAFAIIYLLAKEGTPGPNVYGPDPLGRNLLKF